VTPAVGGDNGLQDLRGHIPKLVMLGSEQDNGTIALGVKAGRNVLESLLHNFLDTLRADGELLAERVVGAAVLDQVEDRVGVDGGGHVGLGGEQSARGDVVDKFMRGYERLRKACKTR
jgi:hypothetical protein